jgi:2-oxoglutarate ferredoxin oxidoreductase subunit alpha
VLVVEMSAGQMVEDVRLTLDGSVPVLLHARMGGSVPSPDEVVAAARRAWSVTEPGRPRGIARTSAGGQR